MNVRTVRFALCRVLTVAAALVLASPLLWAGFASIKGGLEIRSKPFGLPSPPTLENYRSAVEGGLLQDWLHSAMLTGLCVFLILLLASLAAHAFARLSFRGREGLKTLILAGMMVPVHAVLVPLFLMASRLRLTGEWYSLVGPYVAFGLPLSVLLLTAYFGEIPSEVEDAARLDGCSEPQIWWHVALPMSRVGLLTVAILQGVWIWNEYPIALVLLTGQWKTLPLGLAEFRGEHATNWGAILAGVMIVALPVLILFFAFQRTVIRGFTAGAIKG